MNKRFYIVCFIALLALINYKGLAQISDEHKQNFSKAENFINTEDYKDALYIYLQILDSQPDNANINFRVGQCYINILGKERESLTYLKKAVKEIDEDYKSGDIENTGASPYALLLLGDAYLRDEMLNEASQSYYKYKEYIANDKKKLELVSGRIMALGISQSEIRNHPRDVILSNLGEKINTKSSEYNIAYSGDFKSMVFTRYNKQSDVIYYSTIKNNIWSDPINISEQIGSQGDMYATALSYNGKELYLVLLTSFGADIFVSKLKEGRWEFAENIGRNINSKYIESNACISADGNTLYFSSDRASSLGGFDIFSSQRVDGKWGKPENLGEIINSKENEESPFITNSGKTLYFSSDRPGSIGRMDVLYSVLSDETWSKPENIGMPYNSAEDDVSFKYYEKYKKGYIARDLPGGIGKLDLYLIQSGADRQREIMDYMASIAPPKPVAVIEPITEPIKADSPKPPVAEVVTVAITAEVTQKEDPIIPEHVREQKPEPIAKVIEEPEVQAVVNKSTKPEIFDGEYTIQIMALIFPKRISNYKGLDANKIRHIAGEDGYTRYIYGQYKTHNNALIALKTIFSKGYKSAYIRKTFEISNFN